MGRIRPQWRLMKRTLLLEAVGTVMVALASGAASFLLTSLATSVPDAPRSCPGAGHHQCFGSISPDDVVQPLLARGFTCIYASRTTCALSVGGAAYQVHVLPVGDALSGYFVEARFDRAIGPSQRVFDLMGWLAAMPFPHDPATAAAASAWTVKRARAQLDAAATINKYDYEVTTRVDELPMAGLSACAPWATCDYPSRPTTVSVPFGGYLLLKVQGPH